MLVLRRKHGQWLDVTHRSGDLLRFKVEVDAGGDMTLIFDDGPRNFAIERPERHQRQAPALAPR